MFNENINETIIDLYKRKKSDILPGLNDVTQYFWLGRLDVLFIIVLISLLMLFVFLLF